MYDYFQLRQNGTNWRREILAGLVTFITMVYILSVQPAIMSGQMLGINTGLDMRALVTTTCIASAAGCFLMGLLSRYPFVMTPGMGMNLFVVCELFPVCAKGLEKPMGNAAVWQLGLGVVFIAGLLFFLLSLLKVRSFLMGLVSPSMKMAICAGTGMFLAVLGLEYGKVLVVAGQQTALGNLLTVDVLVFATGFFVMVTLSARNVPGAILIGLAVSALVAFCAGKVTIEHVVGMPASPAPILGHLDLMGVFRNIWTVLPFLFALTVIGVFDTFGTALCVCHHTGAVREDGSIPRLDQIFWADSTATMVGAFCGHSTMTTCLESLAGVESGGRTGLVSLVVGVLFLLSLFFAPLFVAISGYAPITASVLVLIGVMMAGSLHEIQWNDLTEAIPAFLTVIGIPFFHSISDGILCGLILYPFLKLSTGRVKETSVGMYVLAALMVCYVVFAA